MDICNSRVAFATEKRLNDFLVLNDFSVLEKTKKVLSLEYSIF